MLNADNVFLVGPMGSGKSAVGRQLAARLGLPFLDSDAEIEALTGVDIPYIFEKEGEAGFRVREREVLDALTARSGVVVATGGGAMLDAPTRARLRSRGCVVYLRCVPSPALGRHPLVTRRGGHSAEPSHRPRLSIFPRARPPRSSPGGWSLHASMDWDSAWTCST